MRGARNAPRESLEFASHGMPPFTRGHFFGIEWLTYLPEPPQERIATESPEELRDASAANKNLSRSRHAFAQTPVIFDPYRTHIEGRRNNPIQFRFLNQARVDERVNRRKPRQSARNRQ